MVALGVWDEKMDNTKEYVQNTIFPLIDCMASAEQQAEGLRLAREVKDISLFIQPCVGDFCENVWENCARIICERSDIEIGAYLTELFEWLQNISAPGAAIVLYRLNRYPHNAAFRMAFEECANRASDEGDEEWTGNLTLVLEDI